ncbi:MAG: hypothetical protein OEV52_04245, partial [Dehalococcoidia bacterium]|nr:hypothetical protein [Dehalococcoidia bacterium]
MEVTNPIVVGVILAVVAVVIYFVIRHIRRLRSQLKQIIVEFMEAGVARNIEAAYACCSHYSPTKEDVVELIERSYDAFRDYKRFTMSVQQWHSDENTTEAYVGGAIIYTGRRKQPFKFSLMKEHDGWRIAGVQIGSTQKG